MSAIVRVGSDVRVELQDRVLRYEVEETFVNRGNMIGEADYFFPLPKGAAFQDLKLEIGGELVAGETMSADAARKIYEEIVRRQRDPALVEWMGYGLLRARIFPIAPGERKRVVVRFHSVAEREGDALRVDYFRGSDPTPPRGVAVNVSDRGDTRRDDRDRDRGRSSFTLTYPAGEAIGEPYSPTHSLDVDRIAGGRRRVHVRGDARDVTLLLPFRRSNDPSISVLAHATGGDDGFALITLSPPRALPRSLPRDVTIVLDASGSMSGKKIQQARAAGRQVLGTLRPDDRFRIIDFSTDVRTFRDEFVSASRENVRDAERYLAEVDAEGSTNISGALEEALRVTSPDGRMAVVLFVTDGAPTVGERSPEAIADRARELRGARRIFTFGVGADLNVSLIEQLALQGRGTAHFVRPEESVEHAVGVVASRLTSPVVTDVRVRAEGVRLSRLLPSGTVDVFAGQDLVMLGRYDGSGRARILFDGETANGHVRWSEEVTLPERARENSFIPRLWATQRIGHLSAEKRRNGGSSEIDDEIRALGERYGIPTEFSSYLVLEPGMVADRDAAGVEGRILRREMGAARGAAAPAQTRTFEAAKQAAEQRAVSNLAVADEMEDGGTMRRAGDRAFVLRNEVWVDTRHKEGRTIIRIKPYSAAYFRILDAVPELRAAFALDDRVLVAGRSVSIETSESGQEMLSDAELRDVQAKW
ncbi:MAG: VIT domain-containing protein [Gemmatimonadaceae bacterium]